MLIKPISTHRPPVAVFVMFFCALFISACSSGGGGGGSSNASALANSLQIKVGNRDATQSSGNPPVQDPALSGSPQVVTQEAELQSSNGATVQVPFSFSSESAIARLFLKVTGADSFFEVDLTSAPPIRKGTLINGGDAFELTLPSDLGAGDFRVEISLADAQGRISNVATTNIVVQQVGSGELQISLSWDTDNTDLDLHVTDPNGEEIFFNNPTSSTGGELDRDDTDGFGPENIFWDHPPAGDYQILVDDFRSAPLTEFRVTVTLNGQTTIFEGQISGGAEVFVGTITVGTPAG